MRAGRYASAHRFAVQYERNIEKASPRGEENCKQFVALATDEGGDQSPPSIAQNATASYIQLKRNDT